MEYYIFLTYNCNLKCSYCSSKQVRTSYDRYKLTDIQINNLIHFIAKNQNGKTDTIVFFGGEPLLEYKTISKFINLTHKMNLKYIVYTNGLLINEVPINLFNSLNTIFVSLDGDEQAHEKYRGYGTYKKIIENLKYLKLKSNIFSIGRITVEEETNIFISVKNIIKYVDAIYWQIVNKPHFNNPSKFIKNYKSALFNLFEFWLKNFEDGKKLNIIPFIAIISHLIYNYDNRGISFRCGAGSNLQAIDIEGNIYWCDEYIGNPEGIIGNINQSIIKNFSLDHIQLFEDCVDCEYTKICLGRCRKCLLCYSKDQNRIYCELTKYLIDIISNRIDQINYSIRKQNYSFEKFYDIPKCTEEIP